MNKKNDYTSGIDTAILLSYLMAHIVSLIIVHLLDKANYSYQEIIWIYVVAVANHKKHFFF